MKLILPVVLNPISRRKDKSVKLSMDTRECNPEELLSLMALESCEGWITFSPTSQEAEAVEMPTESPNLDTKSPSERMRSVLFIWYKQEVAKQKFVGTFDMFYGAKMDKIIESIKSKLDD